MTQKKHHYVPETYLKGFADERGYLNIGRKDDPQRLFPVKPDNVAFKKYYYSQYDGGGNRDDRMEELFGQVENRWPTLRSKLTSWNRLSPKDCEELWLFIGAQRVRVPAARDMVEAMLAHRSKADALALIENGEIPPPPDALKGRLDELLISIDPRKSIEGMPHLLRGMEKIFSRIGLKILHNHTEVPFLTSDNPVCVFDPRPPESKIKPYVLTVDSPIELIFPIDSKTLLRGHTDWRRDFAARGPRHHKLRDVEAAKSINRVIARFAYEVLMGCNNDHLELVRKYSDQSPILQNVSGWTTDQVSGTPMMGFGPRIKKPTWKG